MTHECGCCCGWEGTQPPDDGMRGKEWAERESVGERLDLISRHLATPRP